MSTAAFMMLAAFAAMPAASASGCHAESGAHLLPLVELYTSEGCNSCPPADRWLSEHFPPDSRGKAAVLAFHVDYWDRLGWKDRFAAPAFTERQYVAMRANRATFVYTPQVLLQGRDFTGWRRGSPSGALAAAASKAPRAHIVIGVERRDADVDVEATVSLVEAPRSDTMLVIAYTDSGLRTDVKAGENSGVALKHDHVVRALETRPVTQTRTASRVRLQRPSEPGASPLLVAFVQDGTSGDILQAVALPLGACGP